MKPIILKPRTPKALTCGVVARICCVAPRTAYGETGRVPEATGGHMKDALTPERIAELEVKLAAARALLDAAEELRRLRDENAKMRSVLRPFADIANAAHPNCIDSIAVSCPVSLPEATLGDCRRAAELLKEATS